VRMARSGGAGKCGSYGIIHLRPPKKLKTATTSTAG
jgi:hypothetical protein